MTTRWIAVGVGVLAASVGISACSSADAHAGRVSLAVIDTGVALDAPALSEYQISQATTKPSADHGTMMLSIMLGLAAPTDRVIPADRVVVRSYDVGPEPRAESLADAIDDAVGAGAKVISISMGTRRDDERLATAVSNAIDQHVLIVAAAGNVRFLHADYPARYDGVISVGALRSDGDYWLGSATQDLDSASLGVDVPVLSSDNTITRATGTSVAAARIAHDAIGALVTHEIAQPSDFVPPPPP